MRPITEERCKTCRYCFTDTYNDFHCLFLFELAVIHKVVPTQKCPLIKD